MNSRESLPLATTSRKQASSLNMMSKVSSNGPAFLLRISFVNCQSSRTFFYFLPSLTSSRASCETLCRDHRGATRDSRKIDKPDPCPHPAEKMEMPDC